MNVGNEGDIYIFRPEPSPPPRTETNRADGPKMFLGTAFSVALGRSLAAMIRVNQRAKTKFLGALCDLKLVAQ